MTDSGSAPLVPLPFPPPYRRIISINSDVEWTSWRSQMDLMRIFADAGLETAFSYWFFADPEATWRLFEIDGSPSHHFPAAKILLRGGLLDTLHSFGGVVNGRGTAFDRRHIQVGYDRLTDEGISTEVYSNHGGIHDVQNVGGPWTQPKQEPIDYSNYHEGDLRHSTSYHLDLTLAYGMRFFWLDVDRVRHLAVLQAAHHEDSSSLFVSQISRDGSPILRFRRTDINCDPLPHKIGDQITGILEDPACGYSVIYNHLGFLRQSDQAPGPNRPPYLPEEGFAALHRLAEAQRSGDVLVTTTRRLLGHAFIQLTQPWTIERGSQGIVVRLAQTARWADVTLPMRWEDYDGLSIPLDSSQYVELVLGTKHRIADTWKVGGQMYAGLQWRPLPVGEILEEALRRAPL